MGTYKSRRKQSKYKQILNNELSINSQDEPSKNLMVCNAGLVSGIQYEQIAELFIQYGKVERIVMIPKKSYSFVVYSTIDEATRAYNSINAQVKLNKMDGPIYLLYTVAVPSGYYYSESCSLPDGLEIVNDLVSIEEEERLLQCVDWDVEEDSGKTLKHRRVKHFGYEFKYGTNNVDKDSPLKQLIPEECGIIYSRLQSLGFPLPWTPNQLTVNQYQKGQGIPSHIDTHSAFESPLLSLSLGSDVVMEFKRGNQHVPVFLPRRSLLIMDGEARYAWSHGITPRSMDVVTVAGGLSVCERGVRTSFTLRRVREGPCSCNYPDCCDSQQRSPEPPKSDHQAILLEQQYVHNVYNNIASHFSDTRTKVWPNVQEFLMSFSQGSMILDAGCGNGKYFGVNPYCYQFGFDRSAGLTEITRSRGNEVFVGDCLWMPLKDGIADGVISVAVLHHLSTSQRRLSALCEMRRVMADGGRALVSVWAKDQTKLDMTAYLKQDRKNRRKGDRGVGIVNCETLTSSLTISECKPSSLSDKLSVESSSTRLSVSNENQNQKGLDLDLPIHTARTEFQHQDIFVPWKVKSKDISERTKEVYLRYYHVFEENELLELCLSISGIRVLQNYYTEGNWCVVFEKLRS